MTSSLDRVVDAHHHFWWQGKRAHRWPAAVGDRLSRSFTPEDLRPQMKSAGVDTGVLMQSLNDFEETVEFLKLAASSPTIAGVVGWVPLESRRETAGCLDALPHPELLAGVRHLINFEPDPRWLKRENVIESIGEIARRGLVFDTVPVDATQFDAVLDVAERFPSMPVVLDHLARPPVGRSDAAEWDARVRRAAQQPNVSIKLSVGLDVVLGWTWSVSQLRPYADTALEQFGPHRVMAASNWPVCTLAAEYEAVWSGIRELVSPLSTTDRAAVLGGNALRIFNLHK